MLLEQRQLGEGVTQSELVLPTGSFLYEGRDFSGPAHSLRTGRVYSTARRHTSTASMA